MLNSAIMLNDTNNKKHKNKYKNEQINKGMTRTNVTVIRATTAKQLGTQSSRRALPGPDSRHNPRPTA